MRFQVDDVVEHKRSGVLYMVTKTNALFKHSGKWYAVYEYESLEDGEKTYIRMQDDMEREFEVVT